MDETTDLEQFFVKIGVPSEFSAKYAVKCKGEAVTCEMLMTLDEQHLEKLSIVMGHRIMILKYAQQLREQGNVEKEDTTAVAGSSGVNLEVRLNDLQEQFEKYEDKMMGLQLQLGLMNVGEAAAYMLLDQKKPKSARHPAPQGPTSSSKSEASKQLKPLPPLTEKDRAHYEKLRDGRDDICHKVRDYRGTEDGPSFIEEQVLAVIESEEHLRKRQKLSPAYEEQLQALHKVKSNF